MTNTNRAIEISRKGNAIGFTAAGQTVCGGYLPKSRTWQIWIDSPLALTDSRTQRFMALSEAKAYASTLIDATKTNELIWW